MIFGTYVLYYAVGVLQDFLLTLNWRYVAKDQVVLAVGSSFLVTVMSTLVLYNILTQIDSERSFYAILAYALGIATGTFLGMKFKYGMDK